MNGSSKVLLNKAQADAIFEKEAFMVSGRDVFPISRVKELFGSEAERFVEKNHEWYNGFGIGEKGTIWFVNYRGFLTAAGYHNVELAIERGGVTKCDTPGGQQEMTVINESGVYSLILSSKLPSAKQFKRWVTSEVLPSIRKHGLYATEDTIEALLADPDTAIRLLQNIKEERTKRQALEQQIEEDAPLVLFAKSVSASKQSILVGELAKLLKQNGVNIGQNRLFQWMRQNGFLIRRKGTDYNMPTQRAMEQGLFEIKETAITHSDGHVSVSKTSKVTGKGQQYFVNVFLGKMDEAE